MKCCIFIFLVLAVGAAAVDTLDAFALGAGHYGGCTVQVTLSSGFVSSAITSASGHISMPCTYASTGATCVDSVLEMPNAAQSVGCRDVATGLPLLFGLKAALPAEAFAGGPVSLSPLTTLQSVLWEATGRSQWGELGDLLALQLGFQSARSGLNGDQLLGALQGYPQPMAALQASLQVQNTVLVGGSLLVGLVVREGNGYTQEAVVEQLYYSLGIQLALAESEGRVVDLTDAATVAEIISSARGALMRAKRHEAARGEQPASPGLAALQRGATFWLRKALLEAGVVNTTEIADPWQYPPVAAEEEEGTEEEEWAWYDTNTTQVPAPAPGPAPAAGPVPAPILPAPQPSPAPLLPPLEAPSLAPAPASAPAPAPANPQPSPAPLLPPSTAPEPAPAMPPALAPAPSVETPPTSPPPDEGIIVDMPDLTAYGKAGTVAAPIATLNSLAAQVVTEWANTGAHPAVVMDVLARIAAVAQMDVSPSSRLLGEGYLDEGEFQAYDLQGLISLIQSVALG